MRYIVIYEERGVMKDIWSGESSDRYVGTHRAYDYKNGRVLETYKGSAPESGRPRVFSSVFFLDDRLWREDLFEELFSEGN
jgi:hypothetical protein